MIIVGSASIVVTDAIVIELSVISPSVSASLADSCVFFASSSVSLIRSRIRACRF
jgi:hypothetical protein